MLIVALIDSATVLPVLTTLAIVIAVPAVGSNRDRSTTDSQRRILRRSLARGRVAARDIAELEDPAADVDGARRRS